MIYPAIAFLLILFLWGAIYFVFGCVGDFLLVYESKMQMPLFSGFLTMGGFLLTLKTFILIKLKEGLFDKSEYKELVKVKRELNNALTVYGPLRRLGMFLVYGVAAALIASFSQVTIGFIPSAIAVSFCLAISIFAGIMVAAAWWLIRVNLQDWFDLLEQQEK